MQRLLPRRAPWIKAPPCTLPHTFLTSSCYAQTIILPSAKQTEYFKLSKISAQHHQFRVDYSNFRDARSSDTQDFTTLQDPEDEHHQFRVDLSNFRDKNMIRRQRHD